MYRPMVQAAQAACHYGGGGAAEGGGTPFRGFPSLLVKKTVKKRLGPKKTRKNALIFMMLQNCSVGHTTRFRGSYGTILWVIRHDLDAVSWVMRHAFDIISWVIRHDSRGLVGWPCRQDVDEPS